MAEASRKEKIRAGLLLGLFAGATAFLTYYAQDILNELRERQEDRRTASLIGQPAPDFALAELTARPGAPAPAEVSLGEHQGKIVLISFWASWCRPCDYELPLLNQFYLRNRHRGVEVIGISTDRNYQAALKYADANRFAFPMVWDGDDVVSDAYRVESLPTLVIVDARGHIRRYEEGARFDLESWLERQVQQLAAEAARASPGN